MHAIPPMQQNTPFSGCSLSGPYSSPRTPQSKRGAVNPSLLLHQIFSQTKRAVFPACDHEELGWSSTLHQRPLRSAGLTEHTQAFFDGLSDAAVKSAKPPTSRRA